MSFPSFLAKLKAKPILLVKYLGIGLIVLVVLSFILPLINSPLRGEFPSLSGMMNNGNVLSSQDESVSKLSYTGSYAGVAGFVADTGIVSPEPPYPQPGDIGGDAEDFETTEYSARFEPRNAKSICHEIAQLKPKPYVVFAYTNDQDKGCDYTFKVELDHVDEVLTLIKSLDPKDFFESTYTIKQQIDYIESEKDILQKKLETINTTLTAAITAYDEITALAQRSLDAESLASVITSKLDTVERLTREKITISAQLNQIEKQRAQKQDRMKYTSFSVSVYESPFFDGEQLVDSWKMNIREFFVSVNETLQSLTIGFVAFLFMLAWYVLYALVLLVVAKYGWRFIKSFWKK